MRFYKRIFSLFLVLTFILSCIPVFASEGEATVPEESNAVPEDLSGEIIFASDITSAPETENTENTENTEPAETEEAASEDTDAELTEPETPEIEISENSGEAEEDSAGEVAAQTDTADAPEVPQETALPEETENTMLETVWQTPGNTTGEILDGGKFLTEGEICYYSENGLWKDTPYGTEFLSADDARSLNLSGDLLYYTVGATVKVMPKNGGEASVVYTAENDIIQLYVIGGELRFLSAGAVYSYFPESDALYRLASPADVVGLLPTAYGNLFLTGETGCYALWFEETYLQGDFSLVYTEGDYLVVVSEGETLQCELSCLASGQLCLSEYNLQQDTTVSALSTEEQLQREADYLESQEYTALQELVTSAQDGASYYKATNSSIAYLASENLTTNQLHIVLRARQMAEVLWTPLVWRYSWGGNDSSYTSSSGARVESTDGTVHWGWFEAGKTYRGVPYSQAVSTGYVGWNSPVKTVSGFVSAVNDISSNFYLNYNQYGVDAAAYKKGYSTYTRLAPYYGTDCSGFVSWAWNLPYRCTCTSMVSYSQKIGTTLSSLQVGDCLNCTTSHVTLVTDIAYNANGEIVSVEITEQTPCKMRVTCYGELIPGKTYYNVGSLSTLKTNYLNKGYVIYRRSYSGSVSYTADPAVPLEEDGYISAPKISTDTSADGKSILITLSHSESNKIYYTLDGSKPTTESAVYTGPISVTADTTIRAIADPGDKYSGYFVLTYKVAVTAADTPAVSMVSGYYSAESAEGRTSGSTIYCTVSQGAYFGLASADSGKIYYTTDGSEPTTSSAVMTSAGLKITGSVTVKAIAVKSGKINSECIAFHISVGEFYVITVDNSATGGSISPGGSVGVLKGSSYTFTVTANDCYKLTSLYLDGKDVGAKTSYTISNVTANHTLKAAFTATTPFTDVTSSDWFSDSVTYVYSKGLFSGTTSTTFSPNTYTTRGMVITVLARMEGYGSYLSNWSGLYAKTNGTQINVRSGAGTSYGVVTNITNSGTSVKVTGTAADSSGTLWYKIVYGSVSGYMCSTSGSKKLLLVYDADFSDIEGDYYTGPIQWGYLNGIVHGLSDTEFAPNTYITRQDLCVLIYNFLASYKSKALSASGTKFTDDADIASYAKTAVYSMRNLGIINGYEDGSFSPYSYASRAEVAKIFMNLYKYLYA